MSKPETAVTMNNFSNIQKTVKIPEYGNRNSNTENVKDPVFRAISKYENYQYHCSFQFS